MAIASWIIREKATGNVLFETYSRDTVEKLNTVKYEAVPIVMYLSSLIIPRADNEAQS